MQRFTPVLLGALAIGFWSQTAAAQSFNLTLTGTGIPASGSGSLTINTPPPGGNSTGLYLEGALGLPGNELLDMSFTLGADTFDLGNENVPGAAQVQFDSSGDVSGITYFGSDNGDSLFVTGLTYTDFGPGASATGSISATPASTPVPEPASIALFGAGLLALAGLRRRWIG